MAAAALLAFALPAQAALTDSQEQKLEELEAKLDDAALKEDQV